jgi:type IV fimbrial biogenesis protein FimT
MVIRDRLGSAANEPVTVLNLVRSEAMRQGGRVVIRHAAGGSASQEWTKGWEAFVDLQNGGNFNNVRDAGEELIRVGLAITSPLTLHSDRSTPDFVTFGTSGIATAFKPYIFVFCCAGQLTSNGRPRSRAVMIMGSSGRIRSSAPDDSGNLRKDTSDGGTAVITSRTRP